MKKFKIFVVVLMALACTVSVIACAPFEGFDDDCAIIKETGFSTTLSVTSQNSNRFSFKCKKANGVKTITKLTVPDNPVFDFKLNIDSGRFKLVLVKDGNVYTLCDYNNTQKLATTLTQGEYILKMVAENAKIDLSFSFNILLYAPNIT